MTFENLLSELHYKKDIEQAVLRKIREAPKEIAHAAETAYDGEDFHFALCGHAPLTRLAAVTSLLPRKYAAYQAKGISDRVIIDTFRDVSLRANLYFEETGEAGLSKEDVIWFRHIMQVNLFQIGALQFQPFEMLYLDEETLGEPYMTFSKQQKQALPAGTPVVNCHIQRGADLRPEAVDASFRGAKRFFAAHFPARFKAFLCYSWLLYPPMTACLPETSNIKQFAARFSILGACEDAAQANEFLFGHATKKELPPHATALQKLAFAHSERFGFACGVMAL